jgi:hypothetical protein|tara:strand:+ start:1073 stop:1339 length:267 start_codon:yes stop_codon:yes gene_type:complete
MNKSQYPYHFNPQQAILKEGFSLAQHLFNSSKKIEDFTQFFTQEIGKNTPSLNTCYRKTNGTRPPKNGVISTLKQPNNKNKHRYDGYT